MSFRAIKVMYACVMCFWWEQTNMVKFKFHINTKILGTNQRNCSAMQTLLNIPYYAERLTTEMDGVDMMYTISGE